MRDQPKLTLADAVFKGGLLRERIKHGLNLRGMDMTFGAVFDGQFIPDIEKKLKDVDGKISIFNVHVRPVLGNRPVSRLTEYDLHQLISDLKPSQNGKCAGGDLSPRTRNRIVATIKGVCTWLFEQRFTDRNLGSGLKLSRENQRRERVLEPHELEGFFVVLASFDEWFQKYVRLSLMTGMRQSELLGAKFEWINWGTRTITLPDSKSGKPRTVPLCEEALQDCRELFNTRKNEFLFPGKNGVGHRSRPNRQINRLFELSGIKGMTPHDWRRTFLTRAAQLAPIHEVSELAGHSSLATTRLYLVPRQEHLHAVVGAIGRDLGAVFSGTAPGKEASNDDQP